MLDLHVIRLLTCCAAVSLGLILPNISHSDEGTANAIVRMRQSIDQNDYAGAYQIGRASLEQWEGEPEFDFLLGLSALSVNDIETALFSFERLVSLTPDNPRYRIELARVYFLTRQLDNSEYHFREVLNQNPPDAVAERVHAFLSRIAEQRQRVRYQWQHQASVSGGYDSNINLATPLRQPEGLFELDDRDRAIESAYYQLYAKTSVLKPLSKRKVINAKIEILHKDNAQYRLYDLQYLAGAVGLKWIRGAYSLHLEPNMQVQWLDHSLGSWQAGVNANGGWLLKPSLVANIKLGADRITHGTDNALDHWKARIESALTKTSKRWQASAKLQLTYQGGYEQAFKDSVEAGITFNAYRQLSTSWSVFGNIGFSRSQYLEGLPKSSLLGGGVIRKEQMASISTGLSYTLNAHLSTYVQLTHQQNMSNIELYAYPKSQAELGLSARF